MKKYIILTILTVLTFCTASAQKMDKEAKKQAKVAAAAAAKEEKALAAEIMTYEKEGWKVFGSSQSIEEAFRSRSGYRKQTIGTSNVGRYIVVTAKGSHPNNINSAFAVAKAQAHRDAMTELKTVVETFTVNNQSTKTDDSGNITSSQSSSTIIDKTVEASIKKEKEVLKIYRSTENGKEVELTLLVDLKDLYDKE